MVLKLRTRLQVADLRAICQPTRPLLRGGLDGSMSDVIESMARVTELSARFISVMRHFPRLQGLGRSYPGEI